eukprot:TRINITY_DN12747_c0_g2_i1.p3 TRINITY_DN12747_c0_g2~~TRINITY_DN12747_c0_g2_i1.p3  ORF type:complete len:169 (-),score=27.85 TRINITY_DN12747_c0_g2_i1:244-750(-)
MLSSQIYTGEKQHIFQQIRLQKQHKTQKNTRRLTVTPDTAELFTTQILQLHENQQIMLLSESLDLSCPQRSGLEAIICYGRCCGIPWGPGGPICLILGIVALRYALENKLITNFTGKKNLQEGQTSKNWVENVDRNSLAFAIALFISSVPRNFEGLELLALSLFLGVI